MNIVAATIIYFVLMFVTIFTWFILGQYIVVIFALMGGAIGISEVTAVTQNCINATNITFIAFLVVWTIWYAYVAHSKEYEQTHQVRRF